MVRQVRVNVKSVVNTSGIRREKRDGRDYIIVPERDDARFDIVMNRVRYPAAEIEKAYRKS